jgi:hypothetical protein
LLLRTDLDLSYTQNLADEIMWKRFLNIWKMNLAE